MNKPRQKNFRAWFAAKLADNARDIAEHGADAGYPYITYTRDTVVIFDAYADEIWNMAVEDAESMGCKNVLEMISGFGRVDMAESFDGLKNLLVWYACETVARELTEVV